MVLLLLLFLYPTCYPQISKQESIAWLLLLRFEQEWYTYHLRWLWLKQKEETQFKNKKTNL